MVLTGFLLIVLVEVILVYIFSFFSNKTNLLLEYPSERKKHNKPVPLIGGVILFLMVLFLSKLGIYENNIISDVVFYIVFAIGIIDDLLEIPYYLKLLLQFIAGIFYINSHHLYFLGFDNLTTKIVTFLFFIVIVNAFNLIDGVNGLLIGIAIIYSLMTLNFEIALLLLILLFFNFQESLFMGDSGAFLVAYILLNSAGKISVDILKLVVFFGYPIYEISSSFLRRILLGSNPFKPDTYHLHHIGVKKFGHVFFLINAYLLSLGFAILSTKKFGLIIYFIVSAIIFVFQINTIKHFEHSKGVSEGNDSDF